MSLLDHPSPPSPAVAPLAGADVVVPPHALGRNEAVAGLEQRLAGVVAGSAFRLAGVEQTLGGWQCRFVRADERLTLSWASVAELQARLARHVDIVRVSRVDRHDSWA